AGSTGISDVVSLRACLRFTKYLTVQMARASLAQRRRNRSSYTTWSSALEQSLRYSCARQPPGRFWAPRFSTEPTTQSRGYRGAWHQPGGPQRNRRLQASLRNGRKKRSLKSKKTERRQRERRVISAPSL